MGEATLGSLAAAGVLELNDGYRTKQAELGLPGTPILRVAEVLDGRIAPGSTDYVSEALRPKFERKTSRSGDVVVTTKGTVGRVARIGVDREFVYSPQVCFIRVVDGSLLDREWLYQWFRGPEFRRQALSVQDQTDMAAYINLADLRATKITLPALSEQRAIAEVLGALEDKIEANRQLVEHLKGLGLARYLEAVASGAEPTKVDSVAAFHNRSRAPLSARERAVMQGPYPYYGAAGPIDAIDSFVFDGIYVLVGEDGTVLVDGCHPMVQYVWGQFWVSNHAHVLTGKGISTALLRTILAQADIRAAVTGAVQPKLSMGSLKNICVLLPGNRRHLDEQLAVLAALERAIAEESQSLSELRDTLLPRLMTGELRVRDADELVRETV